MKILGINASPKGDKSQTRRLVMGVLEGARQAGADITFIDICSLDIAYCTACGVCYAKGECVTDDDYAMLLEKMMDADGIVLGSPNYINAVTAQMKTMLDRMADVVHCQSLSGKYGCSVCTAGGHYADEVAEYMNQALLNFGATTVGKVGVLVGADPNAIVVGEKQAKELGKETGRRDKEEVEGPGAGGAPQGEQGIFQAPHLVQQGPLDARVRVLEGTRGTEVIPFFNRLLLNTPHFLLRERIDPACSRPRVSSPISTRAIITGTFPFALRMVDVEDVASLHRDHGKEFCKCPGPVIEQHGEPQDPPLPCHDLPDNPEELGGIDIPAADHEHNGAPRRDCDRTVQERRERGCPGTFSHHVLALEQEQHCVGNLIL